MKSTMLHALGACALAALVVGCGGDTNCDAFISINASPVDCEAIAERNGCRSFEVTVDSLTCGLLGCAVCEDVE